MAGYTIAQFYLFATCVGWFSGTAVIILWTAVFLIVISVIFILNYLIAELQGLRETVMLQTAIIRRQDASTHKIIAADESERSRIAADLHDGVGQLLSATRLNLDTLFERLKLTDPVNSELADKAMAMVDESCREVRTIAQQMTPDVLERIGLVAALRDYINKADCGTLNVSLETTGFESRMPYRIEIVLYRVLKEAIHNVIKHADASLLDIQLSAEHSELSITVEDNGNGFNTSIKKDVCKAGLKNIISRTEYLRGTIEISSEPGKGTLLAILIPLDEHGKR